MFFPTFFGCPSSLFFPYVFHQLIPYHLFHPFNSTFINNIFHHTLPYLVFLFPVLLTPSPFFIHLVPPRDQHNISSLFSSHIPTLTSQYFCVLFLASLFFPVYSFSSSHIHLVHPLFPHSAIQFFPYSLIHSVLLQFLLSFCNHRIFHHTLLLSLHTDPPTPVRLKLCPPGVCRAAATGRRQAPWRTRSTARLSSTSSQLSMPPSTPTMTSATPRHRSSPGSRRLRWVVV